MNAPVVVHTISMESRAAQHERACALIREAVPAVAAVYLFGSAASGVEASGSDVDLAFLSARPLAGEVRWELQERIAAAYGRDVDLVDLRAASTVMRKEVVATGRVLLDADPTARALFEAVAFGAYARLNEERRGILEDVRKRGTIHG